MRFLSPSRLVQSNPRRIQTVLCEPRPSRTGRFSPFVSAGLRTRRSETRVREGKKRKRDGLDLLLGNRTDVQVEEKGREKNVHGGGRRGQARRDALECVTKRTGMAAAGRVVYGTPSYNNGPVRLVVEVRTSCASENWARVRSRGELRPTRPGLWGLRIVSPRCETNNSPVTCVSPVVCKGSEQSSSSRRSRTVETKASMEVGRERAFQRSTSV